ncbi:hypothetical protein D3C80_1710240 [compost metagenome]
MSLGVAAKIESGASNSAMQINGRVVNVMGTHPELIDLCGYIACRSKTGGGALAMLRL